MTVHRTATSATTVRAGVHGHLHLFWHRPDGRVRCLAGIPNLVTDAGDAYHAAAAAAGLAPAGLAAPAPITGIKLGTGTTPTAKNGAGAVLGAYLPGANRLLDAGFPQVQTNGPAAGTAVAYQVTFPAGVATGTLAEATLVTDAAGDLTSPAGAVIARVVFNPQPKNPADVLVALWVHTHLA